MGLVYLTLFNYIWMIFVMVYHTVDGSEIRRKKPVEGKVIEISLFTRILYIPGGSPEFIYISIITPCHKTFEKKKKNNPTQQPNLAEFSPNRFTPPNRPWPLQSTPPFLRSSVAASVGPAVERHRRPWQTRRRSRRVDGSAGAVVSASDPWKLQKVGGWFFQESFLR